MKILPQNRSDWSERALPVGRYHGIITGFQIAHDGMPRFYYNITTGDYEGVYGGIESFHNSFLLSNRDCSMLEARLAAISASNPGFDAKTAYEADDWDAFIGKICDVTYKLKYKDPRTSRYYLEQDEEGTRKPSVVQDAVLRVEETTEQPAPTPRATATVPAPNGVSTIFVDSRQRAGHHDEKHGAMTAAGWHLETTTLGTGDYIMPGSRYIVETKGDLEELAGNIDRERARWVAELVRANTQGFALLVLVTEPGIRGPEDIAAWTPSACKSCGRCDPHETGLCAKSDGDKPMCGRGLVAALEALATGADTVHRLMFVDDETTAAARLVEWLQMGGE